VVEQAFKAGRDLLDEAFYTKQEASESQAAATTESRQYLIRWLEATNPSRVARRVIAFATTFTWLGLYVFATVLDFAGVWAGKLHDKLIISAELIDARADEMLPVVGLVYGFYYAAPHIGELSKGLLNRFTEKK
jgi:hypothetical protein